MSKLSHPSLSEQAEALADTGRLGDAFRLLTAAADDADALFTLATWRLSGDRIRRDLGEARRLFGRAGDLGHVEAEAIHCAILANGAGCGRDWAAALDRLARRARRSPMAERELALIQAMTLTADGDPRSGHRGKTIGRSPDVTAYPDFLTVEECRYLVDAATPYLRPSMVVDPRSGRLVLDPVRTSAAAAFPFVQETPAIHAINRRIAKATETLAEQGEPAQILSYQPGQHYKPHGDAFPGIANQRTITFLVYLNSDYQGGETHFLSSGLKIRGRCGDAISFRNVDADGAPDPLARHAGLPVASGRKLLLSRWIRAAPIDLGGPPGRPF